jgi:ATP-dependent DNA helicase RecQ
MFDNSMGKFHEILSKYWGYNEFRPLQEEIINTIALGKDTLGLMPTGGGKSITFQVFSLSTPGMCLVVTPLIALINDQVDNLRSKQIKALAIYSGMSTREIDIALNNALYGDYKFLYVSPERLHSPKFQEYLVRMKLNLITVDEAHCISQWGYDFRPSYLNISAIRPLFPGVPLLALTATATPIVVNDIQEKLLFPQKNVLQKSFKRDNLIYIVRTKDDKLGYLIDTVKKSKGTGIIYVRSRKKCREISLLLEQQGVAADFYHAGLDSALRKLKQKKWMNGESRVIVATNAFGMGIDKPDVRFVIHLDLPDSLEAYFQEAGRAGRDGKKSVGVMLFNSSDKKRLHKMVTDSFPDMEVIRNVYNSIGNYLGVAVGGGKGETYNFHLEDFSKKFNFQIQAVYHSLKLMERQGYLEYSEDVDNFSRVNFIVHRDELYRIQLNDANLDEFIKMILRSYTGLFTDYVNIDEALLARRLNITADAVYQKLKLLTQLKVLHYIPQRDCPVITFTIERIDSKRVQITPENYQKRKVKYQQQVDAVIDYASTDGICRSVQLLNYFGQFASRPCGECDVCNGEHESGIRYRDFERISGNILDILNKEPMNVTDLVHRTNEAETLVLKVARWMLDHEIIEINTVGIMKTALKAK